MKPKLPDQTRQTSRDEILKCYARLFSTDDGAKVLEHLQLTTFLRVNGPDCTNQTLRHMEGQRALVQNILRLVATGKGQK